MTTFGDSKDAKEAQRMAKLRKETNRTTVSYMLLFLSLFLFSFSFFVVGTCQVMYGYKDSLDKKKIEFSDWILRNLFD